MPIEIASLSSAILDRLLCPGSLGVIHSVFDRAVNIKLINSPRIIALTFSQAGGLPYAMMLADGQLDSFIKAGIATGQNVTLLEDQCLEVKESTIQFDFRTSRVWSPRLDSLSDPDDRKAFRDLISWAAQLVYSQANHAGLVPLLQDPHLQFKGGLLLDDDPALRIALLAQPLISCLLTALMQRDRKTLSDTIVRLLGYGIGGTPSGDDLLVGMLATLRRSRHPTAGQYLQLLSGSLKEHLTENATSLLSLTVIQHALEGDFSEKIHDTTCQLMHPFDPENLQRSLERLLLHGATSGAEMFLGICLGFELIYFHSQDDPKPGKKE